MKQTWNFQPLREAPPQDSLIEREWNSDVRNSLKACIGTSIAISALTKVFNEGSKTKSSSEAMKNLKVIIPGPDDRRRLHRWWAVPQVSS